MTESTAEKLVKIKSTESLKREYLSPQPSDTKRCLLTEDMQRQKINPKAKVKLVEKKIKYLPQLMKLKKHLETGSLSGIDFNVFNSILNSQMKEAEKYKQKFAEDETQDHTIEEQPIEFSWLNHYPSKRDITVVCLDDKVGLCSDCVYEHLVENHRLISIEDTIREVATVLQNIETSTIGKILTKFVDIVKQKNKMLKAWEDHQNFIYYDKDTFLKAQRK